MLATVPTALVVSTNEELVKSTLSVEIVKPSVGRVIVMLSESKTPDTVYCQVPVLVRYVSGNGYDVGLTVMAGVGLT